MYTQKKAATHLVSNPFDPQTSGPPLPVPMDKWSQKIQSPIQFVPLDKWIPKIWSPWTNGPQPIWDQSITDQMSRDCMDLGPNVSQPKNRVDASPFFFVLINLGKKNHEMLAALQYKSQ